MRLLSAILTLTLGTFMVCGSVSAQDQTSAAESNEHVKKITPDFRKGLDLFLGYNGPQDFVKAREIMEPFTPKHNTTAQLFVADIYLAGLGVNRNVKKGLDLLLASATRFNDLASYKFTETLVYGVGVETPKDFSPLGVIRDYRKEFIKSQFPKGYYIGKKTNEKLPHTFLAEGPAVFNYMKEAADSGNAFAQNILGDMYYLGAAVKKDYAAAYKLYDASAAQGNPNGKMNKAHMLMCGYGVEQNRSQAAKLMLDVAQNHTVPYVYYQVGNLYLYGEGVEQNYDEAKAWFRKAADLGDEIAARDVRMIEKINTPQVQTELKLAKKWRGDDGACRPKFPHIIK
ncbi:hypothetical protein KUM_0871 [Taylorella asinigenitalis 14/45]|uniref:Sel1 repeat family protein n=1 Tax=Taylorella asinigenitalis 14/45 TaxID=1091495 RepID=I7JMM4_9BURK|nr:tetratricopeptide repeat protein [Taylorella asinigenitalis]CCG19663.1 hypothetical protein KUM_0871 [Taylorella asinigenitalis 14/45]